MLVVNNFGVKYKGKEHAKHLVGILEKHYDIKTDPEGKICNRLTLDWDYAKCEVHLSMPGYAAKARKELSHEMPLRRQDVPHTHSPPQFGTKV